MPLAVAAFYKFVDLPDFLALQAPLKAMCEALGITGTLLLAPEGVNGTVAGDRGSIDALLLALREGPLFGGRVRDLDAKLSTAEGRPFDRLKVRLKKEIVTLGDPDAGPERRTAAFVAPSDWNALITREDVVVIDVRNAFEVEMGSFERAIDPGVARFSEFRRFAADRLAAATASTVAMYCTGGIRCEKASAYLLAQGFTDVRQLNGGILKYLEVVDPAQSLWRGSCFVFDARGALGHGLVEHEAAPVDGRGPGSGPQTFPSSPI